MRYHILDNANLERIADAFDTVDGSDPQSFSDALYETTKKIIGVFHGPKGKVPHLTGLVVSMLIDSNKQTNKMVQELGINSTEKISSILLKIRPDLTPTELFWWRHLYWSQIFYTLYGEQILLARMGAKKYPRDFLETIALRIVKSCCMRVGLPSPQGPDDWKLPPESAHLPSADA